MSAAMLGGCTPDADDATIRLCKDAMGRRVAEANCNNGNNARGFTHAYINGRRSVPVEGQAIGDHRSSPGAGEVRSPEGRVLRGGLGGSARGSVVS